MGKKSSDAPDYTELANVSREAVGVARDLGQQQIDFSQRQYDELKPLLDSVAQSQIAAQDQQMQQAQDYYQYQVDSFRPVEQQIVADAQNFSSDSYRGLMAGEAAAASARAFGTQQAALNRADAARGLNPNSPAARAARQQASLGLAASSANAQTNASTQAVQRGQAYMASAAGLGRNLPGASTAAYQGATIAGSAGAGTYQMAGNQYMAGLGQGANTMMGGYQTGISGLSNVGSMQASIYGADQAKQGAIFGGLMGLGGAALGAMKLPSDRRLKEDIVFHHHDQNLDLNFYEFSYKGKPDRRFIGLMADEVEKLYPDAVVEDPAGYQMVDYAALNARMVEITEATV